MIINLIIDICKRNKILLENIIKMRLTLVIFMIIKKSLSLGVTSMLS